MSNPRSNAASSVREQKLARVIDREVAPVWHDRFARMMLRDLPTAPELFALDVHSGPGHTTAELLHRLDESARVVALGRDPWLMQIAKTRVRPEWKRRVYFKAGDIDDVTGMNDATYDLSFANLVLGEQVVEWQPALAELSRVTKPGGQVLVTLPLFGTWQEVEDLFEEMLRDEGMRKEVATLQGLRRRRPRPSQLVAGARELGYSEEDFVVEHERFELLFRSGREFLFAPVIEHGPLRLWKAILGRAEKPQALFWRFKESIDTYYSGRVLAVTVIAGMVRLRVPGTPAESFARQYWGRYPSLSRLWGMSAAGVDASEDDFDLDVDIDLDEAIDNLTPRAPEDEEGEDVAIGVEFDADVGFGRGFEDVELSGANELPAIDDAPLADDEDDPFSSLLEELDAEAAARAAVAAEDAQVEAAVQPRKRSRSSRLATLGAIDKPGDSGSALKPADSGSAPKPADSGSAPKPAEAARSESVSTPAPKPTPPPRSESVSVPAPRPTPPPRSESVSVPAPRPTPPPRSESVSAPVPPRTESVSAPVPPVPPVPPRTESVSAPVPPRSESVSAPVPPRTESVRAPVPPPRTESVASRAPLKPSESGSAPKPADSDKPAPRRADSSITPIPKPPPRADSSITPIPKPGAGKLADRLPPRPPGGSLASRLPKRDGSEGPAPAGTLRSPSESGTGSLTSRLPKRDAAKPPSEPAPQVTKPGEDDPFAAMLEDADSIEDIDEFEEESLLHSDLDDDDDLADSFGKLDPDSSTSGSRPRPSNSGAPKKK